mmetsp:Transcript_21077/g.33926  ORF Transcript_21077/g.33926 Transcript_21077/m.33926 type:complete len:253 (-) Transcript_21077:191-949(-)|eukprot:CAMPEP_0178831616 /NCGR_PEP_ID=MMETSP0746-20121128/9551_1 /TAXON_ID=913974 /ORGANISM="Nitzschia punctata, Strain CCMP561" /LENGTH=252 /DNA_ID=CAMNT_0020493861 /DNA_START=90 /DNA_END=848 /DNA_ORIENTATION=-
MINAQAPSRCASIEINDLFGDRRASYILMADGSQFSLLGDLSASIFDASITGIETDSPGEQSGAQIQQENKPQLCFETFAAACATVSNESLMDDADQEMKPVEAMGAAPPMPMHTAASPTPANFWQKPIDNSHPEHVVSEMDYSMEIEEPGEWDVVCGRNSGAFNRVGNRRFRVTVMMNMQRYLNAPTREGKTKIIKSIVHTLQQDVGARFLKKTNDGSYIVMDEKATREKVAHTMRDMVQEQKKAQDATVF